MLSSNMSLDLNTILKDWPHESGAIKVRKVAGLDGREKLQLRIDLGVLQMEMSGRPDGVRPHNCESLLAYHQLRAAQRPARLHGVAGGHAADPELEAQVAVRGQPVARA